MICILNMQSLFRKYRCILSKDEKVRTSIPIDIGNISCTVHQAFQHSFRKSNKIIDIYIHQRSDLTIERKQDTTQSLTTDHKKIKKEKGHKNRWKKGGVCHPHQNSTTHSMNTLNRQVEQETEM